MLSSWANQQSHLLTEEERLQQGHHRVSYSRDEVHPALRLQRVLKKSTLQGWRPSVPLHRGGQPALREPQVANIEQYSKVGEMTFQWFHFGSS